MPLTKPPLPTVTAGEPVTAQGWNGLVGGLGALFDAVIALGGGTLTVAVTSGTAAVPQAAVVAEPLDEGGRATAALPPFAGRPEHLLVGLTDGQWRLHVSASGLATQTRDVTMPHPETVTIDMPLAGVRVPDLFGRGARAALETLRAAGIDADVILDTTGREVSRTALPPEYDDSPVLFQLPEAGTVVPTGTGRVRLVVASALRREPVVTMPSLVGLSLTEAQQVLERIGLSIAETNLRS
jgi:hypothetical protein